jgi:hypothetical protein
MPRAKTDVSIWKSKGKILFSLDTACENIYILVGKIRMDYKAAPVLKSSEIVKKVTYWQHPIRDLNKH